MIRPLLVFVALLAACEPPPPPVPGELKAAGTTISTVNGNAITQEMLDATLAQLPDQYRKQMEAAGQLSQMKDQLVVSELLYREAIKQNLHNDPKMQLNIALAERSALADALLDKVIAERSTDERVSKYYDEHKVQYARPQVKPRVIIAETEAIANEIVAAAKGGADFAALAKEKSKDPRSAPQGGELPWMSATDLKGPMGEQVFAAAKGDIVGPITPQPGGPFIIFKVDDKRDAVPLDEVKEEIKGRLKQEIAKEYMDDMKAKATIVDGTGGATVTPPAAGGAAPAAPAAAPAAPAAAPAAPASGH
jgi:parvulin-like peptidyl-prolyl isomerase